jgi:transcription elongation factor Elf1
VNPHVVLDRGQVVTAEAARGPLQRFRLRRPVTFGCIRCGTEHPARVLAVVDQRELICNGCYLLLERTLPNQPSPP